MFFTVVDRDAGTRARTCLLDLPHGDVETPAFMPVGTNASVKASPVDDLERMGVRMILGNAYHLYLRPGIDVIKAAGGLHRFMAWKRNILTDSGGFQIFSLAPFRKIDRDGVLFRSHIDGSSHRLTPEAVIEIQVDLGSDIVMPLDICTPQGVDFEEAAFAVRRTSEWAERSTTAWGRKPGDRTARLFAIVQGNFFKDLRERSAMDLRALGFDGYAIGGLSVGERFEEFQEFLQFTAGLLPREKPRYLMGIGTPRYILEAVENGIDIFDCVYPTRTARNALAISREGNLNLRLEMNKYDQGPIDPECRCSTCQHYSRSYLRHLFKAKEIMGAVLTTHHNLTFIQNLIVGIRAAIAEGEFQTFKKKFLQRFEGNQANKVGNEETP
ncbi:MAG TPA: tRNA guanosine(34) transglycosylase Tgt [Spirochaetia bacterium]|nr:tRNA guanosine(34) transglycosylase Tgt [Spirochaetia bacterium]